MWETIKNDPILKTVTIFILSILGFGFAFNIMFGSSSGGMGHDGEMGGGTSLSNTMSFVFLIAFKLLLVILIVLALIAIIKFAQKYLSDGGEIKMFDSIKKDPVLKGITTVVILIIAFSLIYFLFNSTLGLGQGNNYGVMGGYSMTTNTSNSLNLSDLMVILLKILLFTSVVGLIIGFAMYVKQSYGKQIVDKITSVKISPKPTVICPNCNGTVSGEFKFCPHCGGSTKEQCSSCGVEMKKEWKCCPVCGNEKETTKKGLNQDECPL